MLVCNAAVDELQVDNNDEETALRLAWTSKEENLLRVEQYHDSIFGVVRLIKMTKKLIAKLNSGPKFRWL